MQINCPNCGNTCEVDGELPIGQHLVCPFCSQKFSYSDVPQGGSLGESIKIADVIKCPHCGTKYEVDESIDGGTCQCSVCNKDFVINVRQPVEVAEGQNAALIYRSKSVSISNFLKRYCSKRFMAACVLSAICIVGVIVLKSVKINDAEEQFKLGKSYYNGNGVEKDDAKAALCFRKAAERGHVDAQYVFALMCDSGLGVERDQAVATTWFLKAAEQGHAEAQFELGKHYYMGKGIGKDETKAALWTRKAAENGHADAQFAFATMSIVGVGVKKDESKAMRWIRKAAENGNAEAQFQLGRSYCFGEGCTKDYTSAILWFRKAAEQEHATAQYALGELYGLGVGVEKDHAQAIKWLHRAAEHGNNDAKKRLAEYRTNDIDTGETKGYRNTAGQGIDGEQMKQFTQILSLVQELKEMERQNEMVYNPLTGHYMKRSEKERYDEIYKDEQIRQQSRDSYRHGHFGLMP